MAMKRPNIGALTSLVLTHRAAGNNKLGDKAQRCLDRYVIKRAARARKRKGLPPATAIELQQVPAVITRIPDAAIPDSEPLV